METLQQIEKPESERFVARWQSEFERDPDNTFRPGMCARCGCSFGPNPEDWVLKLNVGGLDISRPIRYCDPCVKILLDGRAVTEKQIREEKFAKIIPVEFNSWDLRYGNAALLAAVDKLYPSPDTEPSLLPRGNFASRRGMIIHGTTGTCKTRVCWQIVKRMLCHSTDMTWFWCDSYDLATKAVPSEAYWADWLFIDDLGNEPMSSKYESALLRLVRERCNWHRPIILTTQLTGAGFKSRFFEGAAAAAIERRLRERTDMVAS